MIVTSQEAEEQIGGQALTREKEFLLKTSLNRETELKVIKR